MATFEDKSALPEKLQAKQVSTRRAVLEPVVALALSAPIRCLAQAGAKPEKLRPQPGDRLVFAFGPREGEPLRSVELPIGGKPVTAWPMSPDAGVVRSGSRLNRVMVMRLDPAALSAKTAKGAADGIVAYSAVCPHTGCDVEGWNEETRRLVCPCHESEFEVADGARVMNGPAPKPLAMLPLEIAEGELRVARGFTRRVGFQPI